MSAKSIKNASGDIENSAALSRNDASRLNVEARNYFACDQKSLHQWHKGRWIFILYLLKCDVNKILIKH